MVHYPDRDVGKCTKCGASISEAHPHSWCVQCGEPLPEDIRSRLPILMGLVAAAPVPAAAVPSPASERPPQRAAVQRAKRPVGIIVICLYTALWGLYYLFVPSTFLGGLTAAFSAWFSVMWLALGLVDLVAAYGLWTFQRWGHRLTIALYALPAMVNLLNVVRGHPRAADLATTVIAALVVSYLLRPTIRRLYSDTLAGGPRALVDSIRDGVRSATATPTADEEILTNEAVLALVRAGLGEELIVQKIKYSRCAYNLLSSDLARLKKSGASELIISSMLENQAKRGIAR
jgi:Predicted membrane protein (DUF2127)